MSASTETRFADRVRTARTAKAWTQERLAEIVGLSSRTIQRIEGGEEPSLETQRLLAEALDIDLGSLPTTNATDRRIFGAPWETLVKVVTSAMVAGFMALALLPIGSAAVAVWMVGLLILLAMMPFYVGGYQVTDTELKVLRLGWASRFPLTQLESVEVVRHATAGSIRVLGIGGFMGYIGQFRNSALGSYRMLGTNREDTVVLRFKDLTLVVTPDDPNAFKRAVDAAVESLPSAAD